MKTRFNRRRFLALSAGATVAAASLGALTVHAQKNAVSTSIALNGSASGRTFDGIGAISGGGGNSLSTVGFSSGVLLSGMSRPFLLRRFREVQAERKAMVREQIVRRAIHRRELRLLE